MAYWHFIDLTGLKVNKLTVLQLSIGGNGIPLKWECKCDCGNVCIIPAARLRNWKATSCGCVKRIGHNFVDLLGQKFGLLKVNSIHSKKRRVKWNCSCDCGKKAVVSTSHLKSGHTRSCGCYKLSQISKSKFIDISGMKFNLLTAIDIKIKKNGKIWWNCICECGKSTTVLSSNLKNGSVKSCGCLMVGNAIKHGMKQTRLYAIWDNMKGRCYRKTLKCYKNYGGKGITVCDEWRYDFKNFYDWAISNGYNDSLTIERKRNELNYDPSNCTWIPQSHQSRNRGVSLGVDKAMEIKITIKNGTKLKDISKTYNVHPTTISNIKRGKAYGYIEV